MLLDNERRRKMQNIVKEILVKCNKCSRKFTAIVIPGVAKYVNCPKCNKRIKAFKAANPNK